MARSSSSSSKRGSLYADLENLRTQFSSLDPENTGYIGSEELMRLVISETNMDESAVPELLERLDRDKDGRVSGNFHVLLIYSFTASNQNARNVTSHALNLVANYIKLTSNQPRNSLRKLHVHS